MTALTRNLNRLLTKKEWTQERLAREARISRVTVGKLLGGKVIPRRATLGKLAKVFRVSAEDLTQGTELISATKPGATKSLPLFRRVPVYNINGGYEIDFTDAGYPTGEASEFISVPTEDANTYACILVGDSMEPEIKTGWYLIFEPNAKIIEGDCAMVRHREEGATFKRVFFPKPGEIRLEPINKAYSSRTWKLADVIQMAKLVMTIKKW